MLRAQGPGLLAAVSYLYAILEQKAILRDTQTNDFITSAIIDL